MVKKKLHWTQRPENKARLKKAIKKAHQARRLKKLNSKTEINDTAIPQDTFAYSLGYIECWIEAYAKSANIPSEVLAAKLGTVLRGKNSR